MTSRFALVAAAATLLGAYSANAADLGGGCCADLEERVAELEATTARKGNRVVSLQVYGQVGRGILAYDSKGFDVEEEEEELVAFSVEDSDTKLINEDGSTLGFKGSASIKPGLTAGYKIELDVVDEQGASPEVKQNHMWIESEQLGRVTLGQQSVAADGIAHIVLANTFSDSGAFQNGLYSDVGGFYTDFDGGRGDAIRYDSPSFAGFILSATWSDSLDEDDAVFFNTFAASREEYFDVTLRYSGEFNAFRIAAGVGYSEEDIVTDLGDGTIKILQGSASIMHVPTGLFAAFSAGDLEIDDFDASDYWYVTAGVEKTWLSYGATTLYAEYGDYNDNIGLFVAEDDEMYGAGLVQKFDAAAMDIYAQYRHVESESGVVELDTFVLGTKIAF